MRVYLRDLRGRFPVPQARDEKTGRALQGPAFAYDRWAFSESAETLEQEGLAMVDFPQNATTMGPASTQAFELITTGRLAHDGDPVLAEHVANTTAILTERGMKVTKPPAQERRLRGDGAAVAASGGTCSSGQLPRAGFRCRPDDLRNAPAGSPEWWLGVSSPPEARRLRPGPTTTATRLAFASRDAFGSRSGSSAATSCRWSWTRRDG
jgi:hypothetical protein